MTVARAVVLVVGLVYVTGGVLGSLGDPVVSDGDLLGIVPVNAPLNVVHLTTGVALLVGATSHAWAILLARMVGAAYLVMALLGFAVPDTLGLMPIGGPNIALHLGTAAILFGVTFVPPLRNASPRHQPGSRESAG